MIKTISSLDNPLIKKACSLQQRKYRQEYQLFLAEGFRTIQTLLNSSIKVSTLFFTQEAEEHAAQLAVDTKIVVPDMVMRKISNSSTPSGLVAMCTIPPHIPPAQLASVHRGLVLAQLSDPGN